MTASLAADATPAVELRGARKKKDVQEEKARGGGNRKRPAEGGRKLRVAQPNPTIIKYILFSNIYIKSVKTWLDFSVFPRNAVYS